MRIVVDQQLPPLLADWLAELGHDAVHVRDLGMKDSPDEAIWAYARTQQCTVVTRDADFESLARLQTEAKVAWVRIGNCSNPDLIAMFEQRWPWVEDQLSRGAVVVEIRP